MGRRDGENAAPTVIGTAKPSVNAHPITTAEHGDLAGPIEHGRQHRARDGERERDREHGHVRPRGKGRARAGQGVTDPRVTGDGDPGRPQRCFHEAVHGDQLDGGSDGGAQDRVLDEPRPGRPGDRTDNDRKQGGPNSVGPHRSGNRCPEPRRRWPPEPSPDRPRGRLPTAPQTRIRPTPGRTITYTSTSTATTVTAAAST